MHILLADSIDGGILAILFVLGGLVASVLALIALVPAFQGSWKQALVFCSPALIYGLGMTVYFLYGYLTDGLHDPDAEPRDFILPWAFMAGPALATGLLAILVARRKRPKAPLAK